MKFKRLLMAGLMALLWAGTATASQLNSVHVTPKANTATVTLQTTGSFAHKEYRPDEHLMLVDLTGVSSDPALLHSTALNSAVLKRYAVSSYNNAAGTIVTRLELTLGDKVSADVADAGDGMRIILTAGSAPKPASAPASAAPVTPKPAAAAQKHAPAAAAAATDSKPAAMAKASVPAEKAEKAPSAAALTTIRKISVQREPDALDVMIEGPSSASPYRLKNPDRLVVDFSNSVMQPSVKNVAVHTKDVLQVRVGRPQVAPTVTRVVIDMAGPRAFEVVPSADHVVVRIKTEAVAPAPLKAAPAKEAAAPVTSHASATPAAEQARASEAPVAEKGDHVPAAVTRSFVQASALTASASPSPVKEVAMVSVSPSNANAAPVPAVGPAPAPTATAPSAPREVTAAASMAHLVSPADQIAENIAASAVAKPKYTGEPISVNLKDVDLKDFFRLIHEISGLNVVLDPSVHGSVTLVLDDVPWDQALDIVLKNNALDRELQGNVLRIAATDTLRREAVDRRAQAEAVALAVDRQTITRTLSYARATTSVPTVKKFLTARGDVIADERTNSLIISDIPSVLPTLDHLITQLDKKTQEVEIEMRVVSANRAFSRDLGFQLGFNWGNGTSILAGAAGAGQTLVGPGSTTTTTTGGTNSVTTTSVNPVPLFSNHPAGSPTTGLGFSNITRNYGIDAILTAAESHNLAKVLSRPHVVTQNNVKAEVKQGVKIPVTTPGTGTFNAATTYVDAMLRLSVTPQITADNTIFLIVDVENTIPLSNDNPPRLRTEQANTQVLVTDGGTVVIGGVIQTFNTVSKTQTPVLGNIPWLGNLFKERSVQTETDELIFFITPKIIQT